MMNIHFETEVFFYFCIQLRVQSILGKYIFLCTSIVWLAENYWLMKEREKSNVDFNSLFTISSIVLKITLIGLHRFDDMNSCSCNTFVKDLSVIIGNHCGNI